MKPRSLEEAEEVLALVKKVTRLMRKYSDASARGTGLTGPQFAVLETLFGTQGLTQKELAIRLGLAHSTVSAIVVRLEKRHLVARLPYPKDKRVTRISLTKDAHRSLSRRAEILPEKVLAKALSRATMGQRRQILGGLQSLNRLLEVQEMDRPGVSASRLRYAVQLDSESLVKLAERRARI